MKVAVIGSRTFTDYPRLCQVLDSAKTPITQIVSGGAHGADQLAERWAKERGIPVLVFKPDYGTHRKRAPLVRNTLIIEEADAVVAFWDGCSPGTAHALSQAKALKKPVHIVYFTTKSGSIR
jgi:hypothetical protein